MTSAKLVRNAGQRLKSTPWVSIVTPLYNEAQYLPECIESVLAQSYQQWDYTIVDNCSSDGSLEVARKYAARDSRIRVITNSSFLPIIQNHNETIRQVSAESKYCKMVFADDWLYPRCVEEMVSLAERHPSVGLVGAYSMDGRAVAWPGPVFPAFRISGRDVCREKLMGGPYLFGTMTCLLVRCDLIRKRRLFFNVNNLHADQEACIDILQEADFGFVHQVLSFSRSREHGNGSFADYFNTIPLGELVIFVKYGRVFLTELEYQARLRELRREYYGALAHNALRCRSKSFWKYHNDALAAVNIKMDLKALAASLVPEGLRRLEHPVRSVRRGMEWWRAALRDFRNRRFPPVQTEFRESKAPPLTDEDNSHTVHV